MWSSRCGPQMASIQWKSSRCDSRRVNPHLTSSASISGFSSNGSLVAHYAKESSKQLAAGIMTLGDRGYKQLSRYCSELLPDSNRSLQSGSLVWKVNRTVNGHLTDAENVGMVPNFFLYYAQVNLILCVYIYIYRHTGL